MPAIRLAIAEAMEPAESECGTVSGSSMMPNYCICSPGGCGPVRVQAELMYLVRLFITALA
jgi:hypothetical protein